MSQCDVRIIAPVQGLFNRLNIVLDSFRHQTLSFLRNHFDLLPDEVVVHIFHHLPNFWDLGRMNLVCKRFAELVQREQHLWKTLCLSLWNERHISWDLEWIQSFSEKNWMWFARCFSSVGNLRSLSKEEKSGSEDAFPHPIAKVGEVDDMKLSGYGILIYNDQLQCGMFLSDHLIEGKKVWKNGERYFEVP